MFMFLSKLPSFYLVNLSSDGSNKGPDNPGVNPPVESASTADCLAHNDTSCLPINTTSSPGWTLSDTAMKAEMIGYTYIMPGFCFACVVLNLMTIYVLSRGQFRSPIYLYLSSLALADTITGAITLPIGMSRCGTCGSGISEAELIYEIYVFVPITNMSECASAWFITLLAFERLFTVTHLTMDKTSEKARTKAKVMAFSIFAGSIALNMPYFFVIEPVGSLAIATNFGGSLGFEIFSWIRATLVQFAPLLILIVLNFILIYEVRKSSKRYQQLVMQSRSSARSRAQLRLTSMLIGTIVLFLIGNIPVALSYTIIFSVVFGSNHNTDLYAIWRVASHLLSILSYTLDFVIYCAVNHHFRETFRNAVSCQSIQRKVSDASPSTNKENLTPTKF